MKAIDTELTKFLGAEAQYYVPIYQRKYSWKKDNCLKLIDDILKVAKDNERPCHFIGSVIYLAKQDAMHASAVKEYLVIDGQQRLTTKRTNSSRLLKELKNCYLFPRTNDNNRDESG